MFFGPACFIMLSMLWYFCVRQQWISGGVFLVLLILNVPITIAGIFAVHRVVGATSTGLVKAIFAAGDIPPPPTYPRQDVLIARGQYAEAADYFFIHRLARLHERVRDLVGLDDVSAEAGKHLSNDGFAGGDAAGQADFQQLSLFSPQRIQRNAKECFYHRDSESETKQIQTRSLCSVVR